MKKAFSSPVHVGNLVRKLLEEEGIKHKSVYEKLGYTRGTFSVLLTKEIWDSGQINAVGEIIGKNLFAYFVQGKEYENMVNEDAPVYAAKKLETALTECRESLTKEKETNNLLKENNEFYKSTNRQLKIELQRLQKS